MDNNFPNYKGGFYAVNDWCLYCGHRKVGLFGPLGINLQEEILDCLNGNNKMSTKLTNIHKEFFHNATAIQCREGRLFSDIYAINKKRGSGSVTDEEIADWIIERLSQKDMDRYFSVFRHGDRVSIQSDAFDFYACKDGEAGFEAKDLKYENIIDRAYKYCELISLYLFQLNELLDEAEK